MSILWKKKYNKFRPVLYVRKKVNNSEESKYKNGVLYYKYNSKWYDVTIDLEHERDFVSNGDPEHDMFTSETDGDIVEVRYRNFIVQPGHTVTVSNRCKGLIIHCSNLMYIAGTLSMTARGAKTEGRYVGINYQNKTVDISETAEENPFIDLENTYVISPIGGLGKSTSKAGYAVGGDGVNGACGAGGGAYTAKGGNGTSFSGGAGAGGYTTYWLNQTGQGTSAGSPGEQNGGAGGNGRRALSSSSYGSGGGAGNPGGVGYDSKDIYKGQNGTGGLLIIFANAILVDKNGSIQSNGSNGGERTGASSSGASIWGYQGCGSGGGAIHCFYKYLNSKKNILAIGGYNGETTTRSGGNGTVNLVKV